MNSVAEPRRRPLRRALAEMHQRLRTEGDTPARKGVAVFIGVAIGCLPLYGLHLALCFLLAGLLRVNRITAYLASHINNPFTAPLVFYVEFGLGFWLFNGHWPLLGLDELRAHGVWQFGRDLAVGSVLLGVLAGTLLGAMAYQYSKRRQPHSLEWTLIEATARRYLLTGIFNWEFVRGKLRHDPLYLSLLKNGYLDKRDHVLDLGCGQGILLSLLQTAVIHADSADWPRDWPTVTLPALTGVDASARAIATAREVLADTDTRLQEADLRSWPLPACDLVLLLDVLFYLPPADQQALLGRVATALQPGGLLLIREADAHAGWRFTLTRLAERLVALVRGRWRQRMHYRPLADWIEILEKAGFSVTTRPMATGTPFANVLLEARRR